MKTKVNLRKATPTVIIEGSKADVETKRELIKRVDGKLLSDIIPIFYLFHLKARLSALILTLPQVKPITAATMFPTTIPSQTPLRPSPRFTKV